MLIENIEDFVKYIPTAGGHNPNTDQSTYDAFETFFQEAENMLITHLLGKDLFAQVENDSKLKELCSVVVACNGYYGGIPFNDLVQTPNGFGVVSNQNQAPASTDRVSRLLQWVKVRQSNATDDLITYVFTNPILNTEWSKFENYKYLTECVFVTASSFNRYAAKNKLREDLEENHSLLMSFQHEASQMISKDYMNHLITARRENTLSVEDLQMMRSVMTIVGLLFKGETANVYSLLEKAVNTMVSDLDKYPSYKNSEEYKVKISSNYENKKADSTFFF